jgi:hypothetical protein
VADGAGNGATFDPFSVIPIFPGKRLRAGHARWLLLPWLVLGAIVIVTAAADGSLGTWSDIRWASDIGAVFSRSAPVTPPRFPLLRDLPDLLLFISIGAGFVMLHRQWQIIAECLPRLREAGTLSPSDTPRHNAVTAVLRLDAVIGDPGDQQSLDRVQGHFSQVHVIVRVVTLVIVLGGGLALAILLRNALDDYAFRVWVPSGLSATEQQRWLAEAQASWWASSDHLPGYLLYGLLAWAGMSIIVAFNLMGIVTVLIAVAFYQVIEPSAEWFNKDGFFGWQPIADVYQSVYATVALFAAIISILVALLGAQTPLAVIAMVALFLLPVPVYILIPWRVFRRLEERMKVIRLRELSEMLMHVERTDLAVRQAFITEFARCREARIRPMALSGLQVSGFTSVILVPIALTVLQTYLSLGLTRS